MSRKYVKYSREFREDALKRLESATSVSGLCRELGISRQLLYLWRDTAEKERRKQLSAQHWKVREENARLKKLLAEKSLEADFFKGAFEKVEALRRSSISSGATASSSRSGR
jgi:transposase-like protein